MTESTVSSAAPLAVSHPVGLKGRISALDAALVFNMTLWGGNYVVSKAAVDVMPPLVYNLVRLSLAAIGTYTFWRLRKFSFAVPRREWLPILIAATFSYGIYQPLFVTGLHLTTAGNTALIVSAGPIWVVLISAWRSRERVTRGVWVGTGLALLGVAAVVGGRYAGQLGFDRNTLLGDGLMLLASLAWAIGAIASVGPLSRHSPIITSFWFLVVGTIEAIIIGIPALITLDWRTIAAPTVIGAIGYSGLISVAIGTVIFNYAVSRRGAARTAIYSYLQPLVAALLAALLLGEALTPWLAIGGALIFVGVWLVRRT